jgi:hypothetical protein
MRNILLLAFLALSLSAQGPVLEVAGDLPTPLRLAPADLAALPRAQVETSTDGITVRYEGVWLHTLLAKAGVPLGENLRGKALASYVVATAQDGYQVLFSLAELDPAFTANQILLADTANGKPLSGPQGAFRLVVPTDKRGARSIRLLTRLELVRLRK